MTRFALVHGAYLSASCWDPLVAELEQRGHATVAVDLPCEDPAAGAEAYARTVVAALAEGDVSDDDTDEDDVIVVGHSLGGLTIPVVAALRPVRRLVFVAALLPAPGMAFDEMASPDMFTGYEPKTATIAYEDGSSSVPPSRARELFWPDAPRHAAVQAEAGLRRQQWRITQEECPLDSWPEVAVSFIVPADDRTVAPDWMRRIARERLDTEPIEIPGDHSPMVSAPELLADVLDRLV